jgi:hypothetical protein
MTTDRCERCDRPVATDADWDSLHQHKCHDGCTWGDDRCWGDRAECEMVGGAIDWRTRARDEAKRADAAEALLSALRPYLRHRPKCVLAHGETWRLMRNCAGVGCTCGLDALKESRADPYAALSAGCATLGANGHDPSPALHGSEVRRRRVALGLSLREVAAALGLTAVQLGTIERGRSVLSEEQEAVFATLQPKEP